MPAPSNRAIWTGRILSGLVTLFMLFDASIKVLKLAPAMEGTVRLGYPLSTIFPIGLTGLACILLYAVPRTSVIGAILLTGYLGGATATQVRLLDPWFGFPVVLGVLAWAGLYLRERQVAELIPVRKSV